MKAVLLAALLVIVVAGCGRSSEAPPPADALLIVSMPGVGWSDLERLDLPNLERFATDAAVAHIATRLGRRSAGIDDAYLTIGAGTRALAPAEGGGVSLEPDEAFGGETARTIVERRIGQEPTGPAYLNVAVATERNARSSFGATIGDLGTALDDARVERSVIANADTSLAATEPASFGRDAVAALMNADGLVDGGSVGSDLLQPAPAAPWGLRLDDGAVVGAFERAWSRDGQRVVLVELSDLRRAASYSALVSPERASFMRDNALRRSDALIGQLLEAAGDEARVLVVSPIAPPGGNDLALVALGGPDTERGLLRSATTRRTGYVQLADVAPTVLETLGREVAEDAEGRPFTVEPDDRSLAQRTSSLVRAAEDSRFRDTNLPIVVTTIILLLLVLTLATVAIWRIPRLGTARVRNALRLAAFFALGVVPVTFLVQLLDVATRTTAAYALAVTVGAAGIAAASAAIDRRAPGGGIVFAVGLVVVTIALDVLVGAPLQVNAIFGYSVAVAGRFAGVGNLAFALLSAAGLLLGVLLAHRFGARGLAIAVAVLGAVVLVDGLPMFGADVGGVLSMVPAFGIAALLLAGRRIRAIHVAAVTAAALVVLFTAAFVDSARPPASRTHLARLAEHLIGGRWDRLFDSLVRRFAASFGGGELGAYALLILATFVTAVYVGLVAVRSRDGGAAWRRLVEMSPTLRAAFVGLPLLAVLGLVANDSSIAVPATMLIVIVPVAVERSLTLLEVEAV